MQKGNFPTGTKLPFRFYMGKTQWQDKIFIVRKFLAGGGQADTYIVAPEGGGRQLCMKHLYGTFSSDKTKYYQKVLLMSRYPSPNPHIAWPLAISPAPSSSGAFCYLMELYQGYDSVSRIISFMKRYNSNPCGAEPNDPYYVPAKNAENPNDPAAMSVRQRAELLYKTAEIIESVHTTDSGRPRYVYGDISGRNVLYRIMPDGHVTVKLIDADNLIPAGQSGHHPNGFNLGLVGTAQYPAPEVLTGRNAPTIQGDLHSLAVLAFRVLNGTHPLDGMRTHSMEWCSENVLKYFGDQASFSITDPSNAASQPVMAHWSQLPQTLKLYFKLIFSPEVLHGKEPRPSAQTLRLCLAKGYRLTI